MSTITEHGMKTLREAVERWCNREFPKHANDSRYFTGIVRRTKLGLEERDRFWRDVSKDTGMSSFIAWDTATDWFADIAEAAIEA